MRLLVSVSDPAEVRAAVRGGADVVDVKDPSLGPLGAPALSVVRAVRAAVLPPRLMSVAMGDASEDSGSFIARAGELAASGPDFLKIGLAALDGRAERILARAAAVVAGREPGVRLVAVGYADRLQAEVLSLPEYARSAGVHAVMLDTFEKDGKSLTDHVQEGRIREFVARAHGFGLWAGLAGSLGRAELVRLAGSGADVIGVRGAACRGGRNGRVSMPRVRRLAQAIRRHPVAAGTTTSHSSPAEAIGK